MPPVDRSPRLEIPDVDTLGYVRVSTESQAGEQRTSLPEQRRAIGARAQQLGRVLDARAVFEDPGASGATAEGRPAFMAMLAYCESHPRVRNPGVILVLNDSRFGRFDDPEEATHWRFVLKRLGWVVRFAEGDDVEDGVARGVLRFIGSAQASEYRQNLKRTAARATRATAEQGRWQNRAPLGYRRLATRHDGAQRVLEIGQRKADDEVTRLTLGPDDEQAIIRFAFESYASGQHSLTRLAAVLRERWPSRAWTTAGLHGYLRNPAYTGDVVWCRRPADKGARLRGPIRPKSEWVVVPDAHPALISRELFAQVQLRLATNKRETRATLGGYPLSGFIRCATCNHTYVGGGGRRGPAEDPDKYRFYRDGSAFKNPNPCPGKIVTLYKRWIEGAFIREVAKVVSDPQVQRVIVEELDRALDVAAGGSLDRQATLAKERTDALAKRQRVVAAIGAGILTNREATTTLSELRSNLEAIDAEVDRLRFASRRIDNTATLRDRMLAMASDFEATARRAVGPSLRELLRPWIADAVIDKDTRVLRLVIRRIPDVFGSPWGEENARVRAAASGSGGIELRGSRPTAKQNNTDRTLVVVRTIPIPYHNSLKTVCKYGHPFSGKNLRIRADGHRECRTCKRARDREKQGQQREQRNVAQRRRRAAGAE